MVHIPLCCANGGVLLKQHFPPTKHTMAEEYYCKVLESDVFPQIEGVLPEGAHFWWQHYLASSHTAQHAKQFFATKNLTTLPWIPSGADLSPLGIYANPKLKHRPKEQDLSKREKLMADVSRALGDMRNEAVFLDGLRKCRRIVKNRANRAPAHGGRRSSSRLVR